MEKMVEKEQASDYVSYMQVERAYYIMIILAAFALKFTKTVYGDVAAWFHVFGSGCYEVS